MVTSDSARSEIGGSARATASGRRPTFRENTALDARTEAKNGLKSYANVVKNSLKGKIVDKLSDADKKAMDCSVTRALEWLASHQDGDIAVYLAARRQLEVVCEPIMARLCQQEQARAAAAGAEPAASRRGGSQEL